MGNPNEIVKMENLTFRKANKLHDHPNTYTVLTAKNDKQHSPILTHAEDFGVLLNCNKANQVFSRIPLLKIEFLLDLLL